jgi:hypothetical protein
MRKMKEERARHDDRPILQMYLLRELRRLPVHEGQLLLPQALPVRPCLRLLESDARAGHEAHA